ncbi:hypothetical protein COY20_00375 [Candidatus Shapirobacteria bacterium CG_4_10_14_0_2_um_filter_40_12]|uniref:Uncharacterized protein n=1 Tax=Candidatus Shapirobacteria bacterium CG_4_10_14_0_2_um_filter_40_12 TaxID=1974871 RepID=A0A2M7TU76_9BACT|nr:MAG: hypothetical protein COY20_00375 [Candidatus Shapirobacteria bacterium CG_4_10_14_0_2_um_filter_40_12]
MSDKEPFSFLRQIDRQKDFHPTPDKPTPSDLTNDETDDVAAVIAGTKPAALIPERLTTPLVDFARGKGFSVRKIQDLIGNNRLAIGLPENVDQIVMLVNNAREHGVSPLYHKLLGKALGYPDEAIKKFNG